MNANEIIDIFKQLWLKDIAPGTVCEGCGAKLATHADGINFMVTVGVPGSNMIPMLHCPLGEHWACSLDCWEKVGHDCLTNHVRPLIQASHDRIGRPLQAQSVIKETSTVNDVKTSE